MTRPSRSALVSLFVALGALIAAPAHAQFMGMGADFGAGMTRIGRKSVQTYAGLVGMDQQQTDAALALQEGYAESHKSLSKKFQENMQKIQEEFQDTQDMSVFQKKMPRMAMEYGKQMDDLEKGFLADLKALLAPDQEPKWPRVERMRRRESNLRFSMISGQAVDLVDVARDLKVDTANPDLADQFERYELEMDKSLAAIEKWGKEQQDEWANNEDAFDFSKMNEMMERAQKTMQQMSDMAKGVRDVNRQYTRTITPLLPADRQAAFDLEIKRRSFPRVYRTPWVTKAIAAADGFADLTPDQKTTLAEIRQGYERERPAANAKWAGAIEAREEKTGGPLMAMMRMGDGDDPAGDAVSEARQGRRDLDDRYEAKLRQLLSADQQSRLPEDKREGREHDFMGMMAVDDLEGEVDDGPGEDDPR